MTSTQDKMENIIVSAEQEKEAEGSKEVGEEEKEASAKDGDVKLKDSGDVKVKKSKAKKPKFINRKAAKEKDETQPDVLNLNNEVVHMRKEVKRVRVLIIRKLTRQIVNLKKKKGKEAEVERNQRRAARLLEEMHEMKKLQPDLVTKTALSKNLNFEIVCKNPKSTISDRAIARIATHPQFNKKIQDIKAAVKAFKDERMKGRKLVEKEKVQKQPGKATEQIEKKEEAIAEIPQEVTHSQAGVKVIEDPVDAAVGETEEQACSDAPTAVQTHKTPKSKSEELAMAETCDVKSIKTQQLQSKDVKNEPNVKPIESPQLQSKDVKKEPNVKPTPTVLQRTTHDEESDIESSEDEEEKEYFDDSTEERFRRQSSQSEESDDDDFFLGKVSKFKKKKKTKVEGEQKEAGKQSSEPSSDKLQSELDELESRLKPKGKSLQSVFCSSLTGAKVDRGGGGGRGRGRGRGRGGDRFRGPTREFSQQSKFQQGSESTSVSKYSKPCPESGEKSFQSSGRGRGGRGRGRGDALRQKDSREFSHQAPQQALHPSWEASKKRKEQQGQILAFQGKKIKFDDDD